MENGNRRAAVDVQKNMPTARIGNLSVSRLISGSNLISPNMHARDLLYMNALAGRYNTERKVIETLQECEACGINAIVLKNHNFKNIRSGIGMSTAAR
jgi:hypothetical protein